MLLKEEGYDAVGVFMRCYNIDGCAERDAEDARRVAGHLGIPFYVWDFEEEYKQRVVEYMIEGYRNGITPNPDVMCNREIKFGLFLKKALELGGDYVATGHYVRIEKRNSDGLFALREAVDGNKDQSYFLWTLTQEQLQHCLFPVGDYVKPDIRELARKGGLPTAEKKDSQGVCFLGNVDVSEFLKQYIPEHRGALITTEGEKLGEHFGAEFYTIGQRHINADFRFPKTGGAVVRRPYYVASKNAESNTVIVAEGSENADLYKNEITLFDMNIIDPSIMDLVASGIPMPVRARVRYRQPLFSASFVEQGKDVYRVLFDEPQKFVAPGQSAVLYTEDGTMIGGGIIA
jgi:tRNA-specific 2-thiouridylase